MKIFHRYARTLLAAAALCMVVPVAAARPVLVAPQRLSLPQLVEPRFPGEFATDFGAPVIDGNTVLVPAVRAIDANGGTRSGIFIFERASDGRWNYIRPLIEDVSGELQMNGGLATIHTLGGILVFERGAQGWAQTATIVTGDGTWDSSDRVYRIDDGSIYAGRIDFWNGGLSCLPPMNEYRRVNGTWAVVATIGGQRCDPHAFDVNDGRALLTRPLRFPASPRQPAIVYAQTGAATWPAVAWLAPPPLNPDGSAGNFYYGSASLSGPSAYLDPGYLFRNDGGNAWVPAGRLREAESELLTQTVEGKLRGNTLVVRGDEADYALRSLDVESTHEFRTLRVYRKLASGSFDFHAKLVGDFDIWASSLSEDGLRVAAVGSADFQGQGINASDRLYVFEIPDATSFNGTQQDTFENGNHARWTTTSGRFAVATNGATRVLRQSNVAGDAHAYLTAIDWADQSIEADLRPQEFGAADRWFGLLTRRTDAGNYYYVTFRAPNVISLRRMHDGAITELARATLRGGFTQGRSYRMRLESVGDQHVVFVEGIPRVRVKDSVHAHGSPGVASFGTRFDADNVVVSNATRVLARFDSWERRWSNEFVRLTSGRWRYAEVSGGDLDGDGLNEIYMVQQTDTSGDVKWFSKIAIGNQVVSARVRPVRYGATTPTQDAWVGIAAQVKDENNYYFVTLRDSNQVSLRRMVNGQVQVLATVPQTVTPGAWHDLRLEIVNTSIRVHVNGTLKIQMNDPTLSGGGRNALLMYKTAADWLSYVAYQP